MYDHLMFSRRASQAVVALAMLAAPAVFAAEAVEPGAEAPQAPVQEQPRMTLDGKPMEIQPAQEQAVQRPRPITGKIDRLDPALEELVPPDAVIEVITAGCEWTEGPVWVADGGYLLFSDIPKNSVYQWSEKSNKKSRYLIPAGYTGKDPRLGESGSNGLLLDPEGRLVLCQQGDRRLARMEAPLSSPKAQFATLADRYDGKRFNSPNDAVYRSNGDLYFTDPPYGLEKGAEDPARELDFQGVYCLSKDGKLSLLTQGLSRPNGLAFSPDEKTLYVANSDPEHAVWMAYPVLDDGSLGVGETFFDATGLVGDSRPGLPDGMKVDEKGNLFATGPGGVLVFSPDRKHLGTIATGQITSNCAFGDDGSTLYMTADDYLMRIRLGTHGGAFAKKEKGKETKKEAVQEKDPPLQELKQEAPKKAPAKKTTTQKAATPKKTKKKTN